MSTSEEITTAPAPEIVSTDSVAGIDPLMSFAAESPSSPENDAPLGNNSKPPAQVDEPLPEAWASLLETSELVDEGKPVSGHGKLHLPTLDIRQLALIVAAVLVTVAAGTGAMYLRPRPVTLPAPAASGTATFNSRPDGAEVIVDGLSLGRTPLKVTLSAGAHTVEFQNGEAHRSLPVSIEAGASVSQYVELASIEPVRAGRIEIATEPSGAEVKLDGDSKGLTPLTLTDIPAGDHVVALTNRLATVRRKVTVTAGATATLFASVGAATASTASTVSTGPVPGSTGGWLAVHVPVEMQIFEGGHVLGITTAERLMLPSGKHEIELASKPFEFRTLRVIQIDSGKVTDLTVSVPNGLLSINALPWADVFIDGRSVGATPIANLAWPIGEHEVMWRHPNLGERRRTIAVAAQTPQRVGVDFTK